jgi:O-antigen/teichoic acid export membrane protein
MELEELKNAWGALDNRLKESKSLEESIILEIIYMKTDKSINQLRRVEIAGVVVIALLIPFILYYFHLHGGVLITWDILMIFGAIVGVIGLLGSLYKINELMRVDTSKEVSGNIYHINRFNIFIKYEKIVMSAIVPIFIILMFTINVQWHVPIYHWIFTAGALILTLFCTYWVYKGFYGRKIESIQRSLSEIRELKKIDEPDDE